MRDNERTRVGDARRGQLVTCEAIGGERASSFGLSQEQVFARVNQVREIAFAVHRYLRWGHLEKVYENAMAHRLIRAGVDLQQQCPLRVFDEDGALLGDFRADLLVDGWLLLELKARESIADRDMAQVLGYLRAARLEHAMILNFGAPKLGVRKLIWSAP